MQRNFSEIKAQYIQGGMITHNLKGVPANQAPEQHHELGAIYGEATKENGNNVIMGFNAEGLPFQIVVDSHSHNAADVFKFVEKNIVPLMESYSKKLALGSSKAVMKDLIDEIYNKRAKQDSVPPGFTLAVTIGYKKGGKIFSAGFGRGDCGIVMRKVSGEYKQLVHQRYTKEAPEGKSEGDHSKLIEPQTAEEIAATLTESFDERMKAGDEIVGYTNYPKALCSSPKTAPDVVIHSVDFDKIKKVAFLFNDLVDLAKEAKFTDFMIGAVKIPTSEQRMKIQEQIYHHELELLTQHSIQPRQAGVAKYIRDVKEKVILAKETDSYKDLSELIRPMAMLNEALETNTFEAINKLMIDARNMAIKNFALKALAGALMVIGVALTLLGGIVLASGFGLSFTGLLTFPGASGAGLGVIGIAAGISIFAGGRALYDSTNPVTKMKQKEGLSGRASKGELPVAGTGTSIFAGSGKEVAQQREGLALGEQQSESILTPLV